MKQQQSITSLPPSPEAERRARMIKYTIAMTIRVACIFALLFAKGWWLAIFAAGAIFLPYVAVVLANVSSPSRPTEVLRPGGLVPTESPAPAPGSYGAEQAGSARSEPASTGPQPQEPPAPSDPPAHPDDERGAA